MDETGEGTTKDTQDTINAISAAIAPFATADLLATVGALHLMPENASHPVRLHCLAHAAATMRPRPGRVALSRHHVRGILNAGPLGAGAGPWREDPPGDSITGEFTFYHGSYLIFPSVAEEADFALHHLVDALFLHPEPLPDIVRERAYGLVMAALVVSDAVARRAGLTRGLNPAAPARRDIVVPSRRRLARLKKAVTFDPEERASLLAAYGLPPDALDPFTMRLGEAGRGAITEDGLDAQPIVACGDLRIVAMPTMLLTAARHAVIRLVTEAGLVRDAVRRYRDRVWATAHEALADMHVPAVDTPLPRLAIPGAVDGLFRCDEDKVIYALLISDDLSAYDPTTPYGPWAVDRLSPAIQKRLRRVRRRLLRLPHPPRGLLSLVIIQGVGRPMRLRFPDPPDDDLHRMLVLSAADLATIAALERRDPLALWSFARAAAAARRRAPIFAVTTLDEYAMFRALDYTYPLTHDGPDAEGVLAPIAGAGELRREVRHLHDRHGAPLYGGMVEVVAAHDPAQPIYTPVDAGAPIAAHLVEGLPLPLWAVSPPLDEEAVASLAEPYLYLTNTVAYWAWQCAPSLRMLLRPLSGRHPCAYIELHLPIDPIETDREGDASESLLAAAWVRTVNAATGTVTLTARRGIGALFGGPDNAGERALVRHLLHGLRDLSGESAPTRWPDAVLDAILDRHVPLGVKKRFLSLDTGHAPDLDPRGLPPWPPRTIYPPAVQDVQREFPPVIREFMRAEASDRGVTRERWSDLLNKLVERCFRDLGTLVASLDADGLLETLVAQHEALVRECGQGRLTLPALAIGLADVPTVFADERAGRERAVQAAIAARFVIEYVAARPSTGREPLTLSTYDRLQALAALIIRIGAESDAIRYDLVDIGGAPLSAGAMSSERDAYQRALGLYASAYAHDEIARLTASFADHWRTFSREATAASPSVADVDRATEAAWGCALTDLLTLMAEMVEMGFAIDPLVACVGRAELVERLVAILSWPRARVDRALTLLSLGPRPDFLSPPEPHRSTDVYPWRYTRALSLLRRPLLERGREGAVEIVWGPRHLFTAVHYVVDLILSGRLEPRTGEMARLRTRILQDRGRAFNDAVLAVLTARPGIVARANVAKIGRLDGLVRGLGDVDVLAADERHKVLWVIECKAFAPARIPHEMQAELHKLLVGRAGGPSAAERHARRAAYVGEHRTEFAVALGLRAGDGWAVKALIVVDQELATPYLRQSPVPVLSFERFTRLIATW